MSNSLSLESSLSPKNSSRWELLTSAVLKRSYDVAIAEQVEATNKRAKTETQEHDQDDIDNLVEDNLPVGSDMVVIKKSSRIVAHVSLVNLKTFAPHIYSKIMLDIIYGSLEVPVFTPKAYTSAMGLRRWAMWLESHNIGDVMGGASASFDAILDTLGTATSLGHDDFKDAIVDYIMVRIFHGFHGPDWTKRTSANGVQNNLRQLGRSLGNAPSNTMLDKLVKTLVLHYDSEGALERDIYPTSIKTAVTTYVFEQWRNKDDSALPAKVSTETPTDEWCKSFHLHSRKGLPCWYNQVLPSDLG